MKKKIISSILSLVMLLSLLPVGAFATEAAGSAARAAVDVVASPLGDNAHNWTQAQLAKNYSFGAIADTKTTKPADVAAIYDVNVKHPSLPVHQNGAGAEGMWIGIGVPVHQKGWAVEGNESPAGKNGTGSSYFAFVTDKTDFNTIAAEVIKKFDWASGDGQVKGYSEYGWRTSGDYLYNWYNLANEVYQSNHPYLVERYKANKDAYAYTYVVYRINFDVTKGHRLTIDSSMKNGTLEVKSGGQTVESGYPVGEGATLTLIPKPEAHYKVATVTVGGAPITANAQGAYTTKVGETDLTVSATFEQIKHNVTFDANGGKIDGQNTTKVVETAEGTVVEAPTPTQEGKIFMGWGTSATATTTVDVTASAVTGPVTYYAVWTDKVDTGISVGFEWTAAAANKGINDAIKAAGKTGDAVTDSLDQTLWAMPNETAENNHYWWEVTCSGIDAPIINKASNPAAGARGVTYSSLLSNDNTHDIQLPDNATLTFKLWKSEQAITEKPTGTPAATETVRIGANPLEIAAVTPDVTKTGTGTVKATFNQDLLGRYVIELKKGDAVVKSHTTECVAPTPAVAKAAGYTFEDVTFTPGTYTVSVYQAKHGVTGQVIGEAIATKSFDISADITSITTTHEDISVEADNDTRTVKLSGQLTAAPVGNTLTVPVTIGTKHMTMDPQNITVSYTDSAFSCDQKITVLGVEYSVDVSGLKVITPKTAIVAPAAKAETSDAVQAILDGGGDLAMEVNTAVSAIEKTTAPTDTATVKQLNDNAKAESASFSDTQVNTMKATAVSNAGNITITNASGQQVAPTAENVVLVTQSNMVVTMDNYEKAEDGTVTLSLDVSNQVRTVAYFTDHNETFTAATDAYKVKVAGDAGVEDGQQTAVVVKEAATKPVSQSVTFTVTVPSSLIAVDATNVWVRHDKNSPHYHAATAATAPGISGFTVLTITSTDGLSPFVIDTAAMVVAKIGDVGYETLQKAVNDVEPGGIIEVVGDASGETITVSKDFSLTKSGDGVLPAANKFTAASGYNAPTVTVNDDGTISVVAGSAQGGSGGGGGVSSNVTIDRATNGKVTVTPTAPSKGATVTINLTPDTGYAVGTVTVTDKDGKAVELTKVNDTQYTFTMPDGKVTVKATFTKVDAPATGFTDVPADAYYADAVKWAVDKGITNGLTATTFGPNNSCTRGQMVTFLWRAAGSPAATGTNSFSDVASGEYYYNAVLWAVEKGITNGTSATTFSPNATVNRGQTVTFLYRYAESPAATGDTSFTDVAADAFYADAVKWAVAEEITNGTSSTTFSPASNCTRGQIVTFMYRQMAE